MVRNARKRAWHLGLGLLTCTGFAQPGDGHRTGEPAGWSVHAAPVDAALAELPADLLIDRMRDERIEEGAQERRDLRWIEGFPPLVVPDGFAKPPQPSAVMTEVVRRGLSIVPALLDHLGDARPTRIVVDPRQLNRNGTSGLYTDVYDVRFHAGGSQPAGVNSPRTKPALNGEWPYTAKVGDLCFVALGRIVNRRLYIVGPDFGNGMMYDGSFRLDINSPVARAALAAAARSDWGGIREPDFVQQLREDAFGLHDPKPVPGGVWIPVIDRLGAVDRLLYYYPRAGSELVGEMLRLPLAHWALPATETGPEQSKIQSADATALVRHLNAFQWDGLDSAVFELYTRATYEEEQVVASRPPGGRLNSEAYDLPLACARRLIHRGHDEAFRAFFTAALARQQSELPLVRSKMTDNIMKEPPPFPVAPGSPMEKNDRDQREFRIKAVDSMLQQPLTARAEFLERLKSDG